MNLLNLRKTKINFRKHSTQFRIKNQELSVFASVAAHDLKLIKCISGLSQLLSDAYSSQLDADKEIVSLIIKSSDKLRTLLKDYIAQ
jgi:light-regulated signal transduction histidine kinase (bacteriophytochrome)